MVNMLTRTQSTKQNTYSEEVVIEVRKIFGDTSVEYGLALSGAMDLLRLLTSDHIRLFTAGELVAATETNPGQESRFLNEAKRIARIEDLTSKILGEQAGKKQPTWMTHLAAS